MERGAAFYPTPADVRAEPALAGGVPSEWLLAPDCDRGRVLLYLHGGGYCLGSLTTHREMIARIGRAAGCACLSVDYRLAPEHRFPAALEDALAAYRWLASAGADPARIAVAGDSAGGGLCLALLLALRDAGDPMPRAAALLSPWTDLTLSGASYAEHAAEDMMVSKAGGAALAKAYLGGADPSAPLASPLFGNFSGLPPLLIQVGTAEVLLDDSLRLADRARAAGVAVELERWEEMFHVWQFWANLPEAAQAVAKIGIFLRNALGA
jgi:acetyl esterase/lipase